MHVHTTPYPTIMWVRKRGMICLPSMQPQCNPIPTNIVPVGDFAFGDALESVYPLLEIVFSFLNRNELKTVARVKKSWKDAAEKVLDKRIKPSFISQSGKKLHCSENFNFSNMALAIIFSDHRKMRGGTQICIHENANLHTNNSMSFLEYVTGEIIPPLVDLCLISCLKVQSSYDEIDERNTQFPLFDGLFLPRIPNIKTSIFVCNATVKLFEETVENYIKPNQEIKCLLIFGTTTSCRTVKDFLKVMLPKDNPQSVALGGGVISNAKMCCPSVKDANLRYGKLFCISFQQEKNTESNFKAYSFVIKGDGLSKQEIEDELKKFKEKVILRTHTVGFRICCSAKVNTEDELVVFRKIFPGVYLLGMLADGEVGWNNVNEDESDPHESPAKKPKFDFPQVHNVWSTVIVLLTWGPLIQQAA